MKILIVGSSGFIGSYISGRLSEKHSVYNLTKDTLNVFDTKQVTEYLRLISPNVIINCLTFGGKEKVNSIESETVGKNLSLLYNFYINQDIFDLFLNIGSGAEFDRTLPIILAKEQDIFEKIPKDSYGFSKNFIARQIYKNKKFTTLRLFGCFGGNEHDIRLLKKYSKAPIVLTDRYFDYISIQDFYLILNYTLDNMMSGEDINCVYTDKIKLSEFLNLYDKAYNKQNNFSIESFSDYSYTGDGSKLSKLNIPLSGIYEGLKKYYE